MPQSRWIFHVTREFVFVRSRERERTDPCFLCALCSLYDRGGSRIIYFTGRWRGERTERLVNERLILGLWPTWSTRRQERWLFPTKWRRVNPKIVETLQDLVIVKRPREGTRVCSNSRARRRSKAKFEKQIRELKREGRIDSRRH